MRSVKTKVEIISEAKIGKKVSNLLKKVPSNAAFTKDSLNRQLVFMAKHLDRYRNFCEVGTGAVNESKRVNDSCWGGGKKRGLGRSTEGREPRVQKLDDRVKLAEVMIEKNKYKAS